MRRFFLTIFALWLCGQILAARADTFPLADGTTITGDIVSFDDIGIKFRTADGNYSDRVSWTKFSQDGLKQLAKNPKISPLVEPFVEIHMPERAQKKEVKVQEVTRLQRPAPQSLIGALFSSSVGLFALVLIYAANIFAGFEIAAVRARPKALVMGVSAVLPIIGPIIFLALPMQAAPPPEVDPAVAEAEAATFAVAGQTPVAETVSVVGDESSSPIVKQPAGQIFKRGQFTFNRRFIETKFSAFVGDAAQPGVERNETLLVTIASGQFVVERITSITASEVHLEVVQGGALQPIIVPFAEIQEMQLQPK